MIDDFDFANRDVVIFAPHCDDELIGCYEVFTSKKFKRIEIVYTTYMNNQRRSESNRLKNEGKEIFNKEIDVKYLIEDDKSYIIEMNDIINIVKKGCIAFFPTRQDKHPDHVEISSLGEILTRKRIPVVFYSTRMNVPWIHKVKNPQTKRYLLNRFYPSQKSLWNSDFKYFLFEGYNIWL